MAWNLQKIDVANTGLYPSLIDYNGEPAILYAGQNKRNLKFARSVDLKWHTALVRRSKRGIISSVSAEETFAGLPAVVAIDRPRLASDGLSRRRTRRRGFSSKVSDIIYATFDGSKWDSLLIDSAPFSERTFYSIKIIKLARSYVVGWLQRNVQIGFQIAIAESSFGKVWTTSAINVAGDSTIVWSMGRVGGELAIVYFDKFSREIKYIRKSGSTFSPPETVAKISSKISTIGLSVTDLLGVPQVSYQVDFGSSRVSGAQRYATRKDDGEWTESNVEYSVSISNIRDRATSIHQIGTPTIAYHLRKPDRINLATLVTEPVYDVTTWVIEEVGRDIIMPSHKHINSIAYVACYQFKTRNLILARET